MKVQLKVIELDPRLAEMSEEDRKAATTCAYCMKNGLDEDNTIGSVLVHKESNIGICDECIQQSAAVMMKDNPIFVLGLLKTLTENGVGTMVKVSDNGDEEEPVDDCPCPNCVARRENEARLNIKH